MTKKPVQKKGMHFTPGREASVHSGNAGQWMHKERNLGKKYRAGGRTSTVLRWIKN